MHKIILTPKLCSFLITASEASSFTNIATPAQSWAKETVSSLSVVLKNFGLMYASICFSWIADWIPSMTYCLPPYTPSLAIEFFIRIEEKCRALFIL
ncbi:unnamed protein product [Blepharisma stoltei]|uniref:Secreted protein n=1 Tax=Blepharisma stoltei TaxID=1481888 RepID=A0AAU9JNP0_9CILI|nr:unnamed protein product [Blepharisma stoltei]